MAAPKAQSQAAPIALVLDHYCTRDPEEFEEVVRSLRRWPQVIPVLLEAARGIPRYFTPPTVGPRPALVLEVVFDPEDEDDPGELFALIETRLKPEIALPLLDRFDDEWWLPISRDVGGLLNFAIEYV